MGFYTVRSERLFCEQLDYKLLFRWFLDMGLDELSFDHSSFSRNRAGLLKHDVAWEFFASIVEHAQGLGLMSDDHFTVDQTLIEDNGRHVWIKVRKLVSNYADALRCSARAAVITPFVVICLIWPLRPFGGTCLSR